MAEQTNNRDMTDQSDRQDLEDRVEQLESTISKMLPSRRDALKLGGAALVGGAAMSGSASAGSESEGTIGTANDPVDVESEDINNADTISTKSLSVDGQTSERHFRTVARVTDKADMPLIFNNPISKANPPAGTYRVLVHNVTDDSGNLALNLTVNDESGAYDQFSTDQSGAGTIRSNADEFQLWKNGSSGDNGAIGAWTLRRGTFRVGIFGNASDTRRFNFDRLTNGHMGVFDGFDKIELTTSGGTLDQVHIEVLERDMR